MEKMSCEEPSDQKEGPGFKGSKSESATGLLKTGQNTNIETEDIILNQVIGPFRLTGVVRDLFGMQIMCFFTNLDPPVSWISQLTSAAVSPLGQKVSTHYSSF